MYDSLVACGCEGCDKPYRERIRRAEYNETRQPGVGFVWLLGVPGNHEYKYGTTKTHGTHDSWYISTRLGSTNDMESTVLDCRTSGRFR